MYGSLGINGYPDSRKRKIRQHIAFLDETLVRTGYLKRVCGNILHFSMKHGIMITDKKIELSSLSVIARSRATRTDIRTIH